MIFVTGATGNIGCDLVPILLEKGARVRAGLHAPDRSLLATAPEVERVAIDFQKTETMVGAFEGCRAVYLVTPFDPHDAEMGFRIVDAAREAGVGYIVKQSIMAADSIDAAIARHHRDVEEYIEKSGLAFSFLRPNFFMQNFIQFWGEDIYREGRFYLPENKGRVSYIDGRDVAASAAAVLLDESHAGRIHTLTGSEALGNDEVARILSKVARRKIEYVSVDDDFYQGHFAKEGMPGWKIEAMLELHRLHREGGAAEVTSDVADLTGREAISFTRFARDHVDAFKAPAGLMAMPTHEKGDVGGNGEATTAPGSRTIH